MSDSRRPDVERESHGVPEQDRHTRETAASYDALAPVWASSTDDNLWNEVLERRAVRALLPDRLTGQHVLDAGCAAGTHALELLSRGASVTAVDVSPGMVRAAERRIRGAGWPAASADFRVADLAQVLPLPDAAYDGVVCSLVLHYLRYWTVPMQEFARILRPGGWLVLSLDHPAAPWNGSTRPDYFATELLTDTWTKGGISVHQRFWRRPMSAVVDALADAGFLLERLLEPQPDEQALHRFPAEAALGKGKPWFVVYRAVTRP